MIATLLVISAMTPISWVIIMTARFLLIVNSLISFKICAWILTSNAVVGSSAINKSGSQQIDKAITTLWRIPPLN